MSECYFSLTEAKQVSNCDKPSSTYRDRSADFVNACREIVRLNAEVDRLNKSVEQAIEQIEDGLGEWASIETVMQSNRNISFKNALDILRETIPTLDNAQECK